MKTKNVFVLNASLILLLLAACSALKPAPARPASTPTAEVLPASGVQYQYVTNKLLLPTTQELTQSFALNVDGDTQNSVDNKFGDLLTMLTSAAPNLELQSTLNQAIDTGQLISLHVVRADDPMNDPSVSWSIFLGKMAQSTPSFDGSDKFALDPAAPVNPPIVGSLMKGHFTGGPGSAQVQIYLMGQSVEVDLIGVRVESDLNAKGCSNGKLAGGVTTEEFRGKLLPTIAAGLNQIIKVDKTAANTLSQVFDSNHDGTITVEELEGNPLLMLAITPDMDLLDASGNFNPDQDGVKDSYSIGLGFTCVAATFTAPNDVLAP